MSKLFIALAIWIGPRRSRNKNKKTCHLMFLVVPAETLTLESACDDYDNLAKQLPTNASDEPSDNKSGKCKLLRMSFEIDSLRSLRSLFVRTLGLSTSHTMCMALPNTNHKRLAFGSHKVHSLGTRHHFKQVQHGLAITHCALPQVFRPQRRLILLMLGSTRLFMTSCTNMPV
jgi:hypothetical protein